MECLYSALCFVYVGSDGLSIVQRGQSGSDHHLLLHYSRLLGMIFSISGTKCTNCTQRNMKMSIAEVIIFGGIFFILAGLIHLILIFLVVLDLTQNSDSENFLRSNNLMFSAEFNRWAASLLLIGGTILCCCCCFMKQKPELKTDSDSLSHVLHNLNLS